MARTNNRGRNNNNPSGRNQYSNEWGLMEMARERPMAAAAAAVGAAAAGLFLWSKRTQISDQMSNLSDQIGEWTENMRSSGASNSGMMDDTAGLTTTGSARTSSPRSRSSSSRGMSATGGGNASLGRQSGGSGMSTTASGRGRARSQPTT